METTLDCTVCLIRQSLDAARLITNNQKIHEQVIRKVLTWIAETDLQLSPPVIAQRIHRYLRMITQKEDPYKTAKKQMNCMALNLLTELKEQVDNSKDPLGTALRLAIAGNVIDMGVNSHITEDKIRESIKTALAQPLFGSLNEFKKIARTAQKILYLADNAGEIVFDRLLIEQLGASRITLAVRGAPVINDATLVDAQTAGLLELVPVIDNGSDAPGTVLSDCSEAFLNHYNTADLIISKGQGNFETLSQESGNIYFMLKVKCAVISAHIGHPIGSHILMHTCAGDAREKQ
jgi:uncharacterized protein with ATP-grasp and redox domains